MNTYLKYCPNVFVAKCEEQHEKGEEIVLTTKYGKENICVVWNFLGAKDGCFLYSITRADGFNSQERARANAERYEGWADAARQRSEEAFEKSQKAVEGIPFGQPILVGHHSEGMHRAAIRRSDQAMGKSVEESNKAEAHESKAEYWRRMEGKIDLSMPESIEYFRHKVEEAREYHEGLKSGKYPKRHMYAVTYAKKAVNEAEANLNMAIRLWGDKEEGGAE
jgi:hypothetical protein